MSKTTYNIQLKGYVGGWDFDRADKDVDPDAPICIGMDYNANINWIVAGQPRERRLNVVKSFYVKFERKINQAKNSQSLKKTCSNTAPTVQTLSIPFSSERRNSRFGKRLAY